MTKTRNIMGTVPQRTVLSGPITRSCRENIQTFPNISLQISIVWYIHSLLLQKNIQLTRTNLLIDTITFFYYPLLARNHSKKSLWFLVRQYYCDYSFIIAKKEIPLTGFVWTVLLVMIHFSRCENR